AMLVHAASASGNHSQALQLSQISPDQLKRSDDLLFARAIALQRANKTSEAIDILQMFLDTFPKSRMTPGLKIRLALALADNHQAGDAIATLRDLLATASPNYEKSTRAAKESADEDNSASNDEDESADEDNSASSDEDETTNEDEAEPNPGNGNSDENSSESENGATGFGPVGSYPVANRLYMSDSQGYPAGEVHWNAADSAVYDNISGADEEQMYQFIDTLLNFAP